MKYLKKSDIAIFAISLCLFIAAFTSGCQSSPSPVVTAVVGDLSTPAGIKDATEIAAVLVMANNPGKVVAIKVVATAIKETATVGVSMKPVVQAAIDKLLAGEDPVVRVLARRKIAAITQALGEFPSVGTTPELKAKLNAVADGLLAACEGVSEAATAVSAGQ